MGKNFFVFFFYLYILFNILTLQLLQYGNPNPDEMFLLREWFGTVDQDKTGQIDVVKLQTALSASGEKFGENICFLLIKMFDVDGSQSINFIGMLNI